MLTVSLAALLAVGFVHGQEKISTSPGEPSTGDQIGRVSKQIAGKEGPLTWAETLSVCEPDLASHGDALGQIILFTEKIK